MSDSYGVGYGSSNDPNLPPVNLPSFGDQPPIQRPHIVINARPPVPAPVGGQSGAADPWAAFPDQPAAASTTDAKAAKPAEGAPNATPAGATGDAWAAFPDAPKEAAKPQRDVSGGEAASRGVLNSLTFGAAPAIAGLAAASGIPSSAKDETEIDPNPIRPVVGAAKLLHSYFSDHPDQDVRNAYDAGRKDALDQQTLAQQQHPEAYLAGQLGGALLTPLGIAGGAAKGVAAAKTALPAIARGIGVGAGGGALFGAGEGVSEGESPTDIALDAGKGAATGAAFGGVGSTGAELIGKGVGKVASIARGTRDVDAEAGRRVASALASDFENEGPQVAPAEIAAGNTAGTPRAIIDAGGERTRALARSSANTSPEGRQALNELTQSRYENQSPRIATFIRNLAGGGHAADDEEALKLAARRANKPAYQKAYALGDKEIWTPELERLTSAPSVTQAMRAAVNKWKDWQVVDGFGAVNPGATRAPGGIIKFQQGKTGVPTFPNIQFWDYTARHLADKAEAARRAGRTHFAAQIGGLERQLKAELDKAVPAYGAARSGAFKFFKADDALDAGRSFVMSNASIPEARRALSQMSAPERILFARGFASDLADRIERTGNSRNVLNSIFLDNSAARQKIELALGKPRADQLEALLRIESVVDRARKALGNSTTARQLAEMGIAGGAVATLEGIKEHDFNPAHIIAAALTYGAVRHGAKIIDERVARRVGEMLASDDPAILAKGMKVVTASPVYFNGLRRATGAASRVGAHDIGGAKAAAGLAAAFDSTIGRAEHSMEHHDEALSDTGQ